MYFPMTPISYAVEITFECNNHCPGCANVLEGRRHETLTRWRELFDRIAPPEDRGRYAELIRISGGEPTLHPEFQDIIRSIDTFGIPHATFSNGRWKNPQEILSLFQDCRNFVGLLISLHGHTAADHEAFIGGMTGAFEETCRNIRKAAEAGLEVFTNTVLTRHNCDHIEEIIALSQALGAEYAVFNRYLGKSNPIEPSEAQLRRSGQMAESNMSPFLPPDSCGRKT